MRTHRIEKLVYLSLVLSIFENNCAKVSIIDGVANKSLYKFCYKRHIATAQKTLCADHQIRTATTKPRRPTILYLPSYPPPKKRLTLR